MHQQLLALTDMPPVSDVTEEGLLDAFEFLSSSDGGSDASRRDGFTSHEELDATLASLADAKANGGAPSDASSVSGLSLHCSLASLMLVVAMR